MRSDIPKPMMNEDGVAYTWAVICVFLVVIGLVYVVMTPAVNIITGEFNGFIDQGMVSTQTKAAFDFNLGMFTAIPIVGLLILFIYAFQKATEERYR